MKQYLLSIYQPDGDPPAPDVLASEIMCDVQAVEAELRSAGAWVFSGGLHAPSTATVVHPRREEVPMTDGPYVEGKEHIGGLTIIKADDLDEALAWGSKLAGATTLPVEVRPSARRAGRLTALVASVPHSEIERVFREQYGRAVAVLVRVFGDIDLAEDAVQEAFTTAVATWPSRGLPPAPAGWIITTARGIAVRRPAAAVEASRDDRHDQAVLLRGGRPAARGESPVRDDRLRLIFTCCHPALDRAAQVALTLRLLGGMTPPEIARAFRVSEPTMAVCSVTVRAKGKIRDARIPYRVPNQAELPARLASVLAVIYLIFNEGYTASSGGKLMRRGDDQRGDPARPAPRRADAGRA